MMSAIFETGCNALRTGLTFSPW